MSELLVLCYHAISPDWPAPLAVTPQAFQRQIANLSRRGWQSTTFTDAVRRAPGSKTVVITFDDAFASVARYAEPVLSGYGFPATVFAPTDYVSHATPLAWTGVDQWLDSPHADELTPMAWDDLRRLTALGWEVGSHTRTHPFLTSLSDEEVLAELCDSREEGTEHLGQPITSLAYPYGAVNARIAAHAANAGYEGAASLAWPSGPIDRYRFPRVGVYHRDRGARFRLKTARLSRSTYGSKLLTRRAAHAQSS